MTSAPTNVMLISAIENADVGLMAVPALSTPVTPAHDPVGETTAADSPITSRQATDPTSWACSFEAVASGRAAAFGSAHAGDGALRQAPATNSPTTSARSSPTSNRTQAIAGALAKTIRAGAARRWG